MASNPGGPGGNKGPPPSNQNRVLPTQVSCTGQGWQLFIGRSKLNTQNYTRKNIHITEEEKNY